MSEKDLSRLARRGSGSASRSIFGGFAEWEKGHDDETSYAHAIDAQGWEEDLSMVFVVINNQSKKYLVVQACPIQETHLVSTNIG